MYVRSRWFLFGVFLLGACTGNGVVRDVKIEPTLARMGHADTITVSVGRDVEHIDIAVLPGGPYIKSESLRSSLLPSPFSKFGARLEISGDGFGLVGNDGVERYELSHSPKLIEFNQQSVCVLDDQQQLIHIERVNKQRTSTTVKAGASAIEAYEHGCVVMLDQQSLVHYLPNSNRLVESSEYRLDNQAWDIRAEGRRLLVADGLTGLTVLDMQSGSLGWVSSYNKLGDVRLVAGDGEFVIVADQHNTLSLISLEREGTARLISDFHLPHPVSALALKDLQVWAASGEQVYQIDFSSLGTPVLSYLGVNLGGSRRSFLDGDLIYVADWFSGMHIYDVSIPNAPRLVSSLHTPGSPKGVIVKDNIAYIADDDHGLQIANVKNTRRPAIIAELPLSGLAYTMKLVGSRLYVAAHRGGLHIVDVANPAKPKLLGTLDTAGKSWAVHVLGNLAFVADDDSGVLVVDVSEPGSMRVVEQFSPGGHAEDIVIRDNLAYVAFFEQGLFILDISNPRHIRQLAHLPTPGNARGIQLDGDTLYLASWEAGLQVVDIASPHKPRIVGHYDTKGDLWGLEQRTGIVYGLDWWGGLKIIDVTQRETPRLIGQYQNAGKIHHIAKQNNYLYLAASQRGLQVFDGKNPLNPVWATGVDVDGSARDVLIRGDTAYVAVAELGVALVDISNPFHARWKGRVELPRGVDILAGYKDFILAGKTGESLELLSIDKQGELQLTDYISLKPKLLAVVEDGFLIVDTNGDLFLLCDLDRHSSALRKLRSLGRHVERVAVGGSHLFAYTSDKQIQRYVLPNVDVLTDTVQLEQAADGLAFFEGRLFVSRHQNGVLVINYSGSKPLIEMEYAATHSIEQALITEEAIFLAGENIIVSGERLPGFSVSKANGKVQITLSPDMPMGSYDLRLTENGVQTHVRNAFEVGFKKPAKSHFTLEDLKKKMQQGNFEGKAP
ncbi:MAG: hypothetical protein OEZ43_03310 [Gammaproteobacteria bacterium]|nr:hypothetical protein [Gammaproteobacteria bacterium]